MYKVEHVPAEEIRKDFRNVAKNIYEALSADGITTEIIKTDTNKITGKIHHKHLYPVLKLSDVVTYGIKYHDKKLVGWICERPFFMSACHTIIKLDREGKECVRLSIYGLDSKVNNSNIHKYIPLNAKITVYEPFFKQGMDGRAGFRVDDVSELEVTMDKSEHFKLLGNDYFGKKDYRKSIEYYSKGIEEDNENYLLYGNRSGAYYYLNEFDSSYYDAKKAIELNDQWYKGYVRASKALFGLKRFMESYDFICKALLLDNDANGDIMDHFNQLLAMRRKDLLSAVPLKVVPPPFPNLTENPNKKTSSSSPTLNGPVMTNNPNNSNSNSNNIVNPSSPANNKKNLVASVATPIVYQEKSIKELEKEINSVGSQKKQKKKNNNNNKKQIEQPQPPQSQPPQAQPEPEPQAQQKVVSQPTTTSTISTSTPILIRGWKIIQNGGKMGPRCRAAAVEFGDSILVWGGEGGHNQRSKYQLFNVGLDIDSPIVYDTRKDAYSELLFKINSRINHSMVRVNDKVFIIGGNSPKSLSDGKITKIDSNKTFKTICIDLEKSQVNKSFTEFGKPSKEVLKSCNAIALVNTVGGNSIGNDQSTSTLISTTSPIIWVLDSNCDIHWLNTLNGEWTTLELSIKPPKRSFTCLTSVGTNQRYTLMYGGSDGISKLKDMWCFDTVNNEWMQLTLPNKSSSIPNTNKSKGFNYYTSDNGIKYCIFLDDKHSLWTLNTQTLQWREVHYIVPSPMPSLEEFTQVVVDGYIYIIGGQGSNIDSGKQVSDDIFSFPIGEVIESFEEASLTDTYEHNVFGETTMPKWTCFTCGKLTAQDNVCSSKCQKPILFCTPKCKLRCLAAQKHTCQEQNQSQQQQQQQQQPTLTSVINNEDIKMRSLEEEMRILELERQIIKNDLEEIVKIEKTSGENYKEYIQKEKAKLKEVESKITVVQKKINDEEDSKLCSICMDNRFSHIINCGHAYCLECINDLKCCPLCKEPIKSKIKIYYN